MRYVYQMQAQNRMETSTSATGVTIICRGCNHGITADTGVTGFRLSGGRSHTCHVVIG